MAARVCGGSSAPPKSGERPRGRARPGRRARRAFEPFDIPEATDDGRVDLRDLVTFTIDPETAKDFDDALSVRAEGDGLRAWVHIADVSHFVPAGSPLDRGAAERANSVYVPVSRRRCSRTSSPTRPARCGHRRRPSDGHSGGPLDAQLRPERAEVLPLRNQQQRTLQLRAGAADPHRRRASSELVADLRLTERLATELRRRRFAAARCASKRSRSSSTARAAWSAPTSRPRRTHMLVEELMIFANEAVAAFLADRGKRRYTEFASSLSRSRCCSCSREKRDRPGHTDPACAGRRVDEPGVPQRSPPRRANASRSTSRSRAAGRRRSLRSNAPGSEAGATRATSAIRVWPASRTATSPRRSGAIRIVVHRALLQELGKGDDPPPGRPAGPIAEHPRRTSARRPRSSIWPTRSPGLAARVRALRGAAGKTLRRRVIGVIPSGLFIRFGTVFEGYLPVRRLGGDAASRSTSSAPR